MTRDIADPLPNRDNALHVVLMVGERLSGNWRRADESNLCQTALDGDQVVTVEHIAADVLLL